MNNKRKYYGIIPPLVTPLKADETLDVQGVKNLVDYCVKGGVTGVFVNGTSGEALRLPDCVWEANTHEVLKAVDNRVPVFCGAIDTCTTRVIEKIKKIEDMGGQIAVCTPPFYLTSFGQDEIVRHYEKICSKTNIDIAVYNIPETTHANILPETIDVMADWDRIVAYKDSTADWQQLQRVLFLCENKDIAIFNGAEELCASAMLYGADGCIPGLSNYIPALFVELYKLCKAEKVRESYELQKRIYKIRKCIFINGCWMSGMKHLLKVFGIAGDGISSALVNLTEDQEKEALAILRNNGIANL